jgi:hypothetical protein
MDRTQDWVEIYALLNRHQIYIDLQDAEGYASVYAEDGRYKSSFGSAQGTTDLMEMTKNLHDSGFTAGKRHYMGPAMIDIDDDQAEAISYWWVADYTTSPPTVFATGTYRDELRKVDGQWRIVQRVQTGDSDESVEE